MCIRDRIWFDRSRYNYIDYEIGHGNVEVGFSCIIKQGDDYLYSFRIEPTTDVYKRQAAVLGVLPGADRGLVGNLCGNGSRIAPDDG